MKDILEINAKSRKEVGKKIAKKLRAEGKIPAIIYGKKKDSIPISISLEDVKEILKAEKGENTILRIHRDDIYVDAMLKEVQYDYLVDNIIHVDLIRIDLDKQVDVNVPIVVEGEPIGVRIEDGIFDFVTREVRVRCLPNKIPKEFKVDINELHTGQSIRVGDLEEGEDFKFISHENVVICAVTVKGKMIEVEEEVVEEEAEEEAEEAKEKEQEEPKEEKKEEKKESKEE